MEKTLLIMAAGMGSRFGGLKQITPMGPNGEFIIDYSIYDAKKAGFTKVVFVIKEENYDLFRETIGARVESHIQVEYCFQNNDYVPEKYLDLIKDRTKPLGTGYAILCAKDKINEPFAVINADDFYGRDAFMRASETLENLKQTAPYEYAMICYKVKNTITENGSVKRGVCEIENGYLEKITECSIEKVGNTLQATPLSAEQEPFTIEENSPVSMNMLLFTPSMFPYLEKQLVNFFEKNKDDLSSCEYFIPDAMFASIKEKYAKVLADITDSLWYGVTYKEDSENVRNALKSMVSDNIYPNDLWEDER